MLNRSVSLMGQASVVLTSRKMPLPTGVWRRRSEIRLVRLQRLQLRSREQARSHQRLSCWRQRTRLRAIPGVDQRWSVRWQKPSA